MYYVNLALMPLFIALVTRELTNDKMVLSDASQIDLFNSRWYYKVGTVIMTTIFTEVILSSILNVIEFEFLSKLFMRCYDQKFSCSARKTRFKVQ
jgi:hypothetical protein